MEIERTKLNPEKRARKLKPGWIIEELPPFYVSFDIVIGLGVPMTSRETSNIWFYIKHMNLKYFFKKRLYKTDYFWHDSFAIYFRRLFGCKHRLLEVYDSNDKKHLYCFKCERFANDLYAKNKLNEKQLADYFTRSL